RRPAAPRPEDGARRGGADPPGGLAPRRRRSGMRRSRSLLLAGSLACGFLANSPAQAAQVLTHTVGQLTVIADPSLAYPGGLLTLHLRPPLGACLAILNGPPAPLPPP